MTYQQAMNVAKELRPSEFSDFQLARWLCELDGQLMLDYVAQYATQPEMDASYDNRGAEDGIAWANAIIDLEDSTEPGWSELMGMDLQAVQAPYDGLYVDYLCMEIDQHNADYERSNNDMALYTHKLVQWLNRLSRRNWHNLNKYDPETGRMPTVLMF